MAGESAHVQRFFSSNVRTSKNGVHHKGRRQMGSGWSGIYPGNMPQLGVEQQKYEADNRLRRLSGFMFT